MFRRILAHEWRMLTSDATVWTLIAIFALSIGYGTLNGARWTRFQHDAISQAEREERDRLAAHQATIVAANTGTSKVSPFLDPRNPEVAGRRLAGRYAVMPPAPLAALSIGQSDLLPYYFKMTTDAKETVTAGAELENPQRLLAGRFDLAFVIIYLYPLLILAISYNLLSAEKEQGTLALVLSQPVALRTLALAKVTLRLLLFLATIGALATIALLAAGVDLGNGGVRFALWFAAVAVYGLFWFGLASAVASLGRPSATNAMTLAAIWLALVVLLPSMFNLLATTVYPVPSRVEMVQAVREASDEANGQGSVLLSKYYEDHPELAAGGAEQAMNDFNVIRVAVNAEVERRVRPVMDQYGRQLVAQQSVIDRLRFLSPAVLMQDALNDISGTGAGRHRHFMAQVSAYHETWRGYFVPLIFRKAQLSTLADIPRFRFQDEPFDRTIARVATALGGVLLPGVALFVFGLRALRRYKVA